MFKGRHFDRSVILLCVRWYLAYGLSLRDLEEMMAERGIYVDHSTIHRWVLRFSPDKRRIRPMLGFKTQTTAEIVLSGVELVRMVRKRQARFAYNPAPTLAEQFNILAA
jgi:transposase-like protein